MFKELHPLIQNRPLTITVAALGDGKIRVNVVPRALESDGKANEKIGYSNKDQIAKVPDSAVAALTTPLSLTGLPEELDAELPRALTHFAESHVQLQSTLQEATAQIAVAVKEIQERDKSKPKPKAGKAEEKPQEKAPAGGLLPLWVKPAADPAATESGPTGPELATESSTAPTQPTLNSEQPEEVTQPCQSQ